MYHTVMGHYHYELAEFTPGDAEAITGVSTVLQRDWRRRGILPANEDGHARFDVHGLAELMILKSLSDRGLGPQAAKAVAEIGSGAVVHGALQNEDAFQVESRGPAPAAIDPGAVVRRTSPNKMHRNVMPAPYLIIWADGSEVWQFDVQKAIDAISKSAQEDKLGGPITIIDQYAMGNLLFRRAGRPLVSVEWVK